MSEYEPHRGLSCSSQVRCYDEGELTDRVCTYQPLLEKLVCKASGEQTILKICFVADPKEKKVSGVAA